MCRGAVTSPALDPVPEFDESVLRGERLRFVLLVSVVMAVVVARWALG